MRNINIDWSECAAVETVPGKMSGAPVVRDTRVRPEDLLVNRSEGLPWLEENFGVPVAVISEIFAFHDAKKRLRAPVAG
jgi:uncharacterized protein (DUF433 family)